MGKTDVQFISTPKKELKTWLDQLDQEGQRYVKARIARLLPLLEINIHSGVMQTLPHFWCPQTSTFIFGEHELTPTLEEYSVAIGMPLEKELVRPPIGIDSISELSQFLTIKAEMVRKVVKANCYACPFSFLAKCFANQPMISKARIFILAFFGLIVFPYRKNAINPSISWVVSQVCDGLNYVNMILAETFLSLNHFKQNEERTMRALPELLQIWFFSHIKGFGHLMKQFNIDDFRHPIQKFEVLEHFSPNKQYSCWIIFLKNANPEAFLWHAKWFHVEEARFSHKYDEPIPLLGLSGTTSYYPYRVARQYRALQEVPPPLKMELFQVRFTRTDYDYFNEIQTIIAAWNECHPEKILVPKRLKGEEETHHASTFYIQQHRIPAALRPVVPDVTEKPTQQARIEHLKRKVEMAEAENKKLRKALGSRKHIK